MEINLPSGVYAVAVSGGVDSMVLLDLLRRQKGLELIVAHFDHGIRDDTEVDYRIVNDYATKHGLKFESARVNLGPGASEDAARQARYEFLRKVCKQYQATAIVTAHHQDDMLETAMINLLRGTGRKGITSLGSGGDLVRPLLPFSKSEIIDYAKKNDITWHEDYTNADTDYLRNYIRLNLLPAMSGAQRQAAIDQLTKLRGTNLKIDQEIADYLHLDTNKSEIDKKSFINLPHDLACEVMAEWLRHNDIRDFDRAKVTNLVIAAKTLRHDKRASINKTKFLKIDGQKLQIAQLAGSHE